jgi:SH3-like domain-containing protein
MFLRKACGCVAAGVVLFSLFGCTREVTVNLTVDGIPVSSEVRTISSPDPNCRIRADWYFARWFAKPIGKKKPVEFEPSSQPLAFDELNTLPGDTEVVSMHLRVVNPKGLTYRITKVLRQGEKAVQTPEIIYEGSRTNNFLVVRGPIVQRKIVSLGVIIGVVENYKERPLFYAGDLEYRIEPKRAQDLPTLASAQSAGASPASGKEKRALTIAPEARSRLLAPSPPFPEAQLMAKLPEAKEPKAASLPGKSPSLVEPGRAALSPPSAVDSLQWENWSPGAIAAPIKTESARDSPGSGEGKGAVTLASTTAPEARPPLLAPSPPLPEAPLLAKLPEAKEPKSASPQPFEGKPGVSLPPPGKKEKIAGSPAPAAKESPGRSTSPRGAKDLPLSGAAGGPASPAAPEAAVASLPQAVDSLLWENWSPGAIAAPVKTESAAESTGPVKPGSAGDTSAPAAAESLGRLTRPGRSTDLPLPGAAAGSPSPVEPGRVTASRPSGATAAPARTKSAPNLPSPPSGDLASYVGKGRTEDLPLPRSSAPPKVRRQTFYVGAEPLDVRAYPDKDAPLVSVLARNEAVEQVGQLEDWVQVRVKRTGRLGWVNPSTLAFRPAATPLAAEKGKGATRPLAPPQRSRPTLYVAADLVNLRAAPDLEAPRLSVLKQDEEVEKVGDAEDWSQVRVKRTGSLGWVNKAYLASRPAATAPEARPRPPAPAALRPMAPSPAKPVAKEAKPVSPPPFEGKPAASLPTPVEKEKIVASPAPVATESPGRSTSPGGAKDLPLTGAAGESPPTGEPGRAAASRPSAVDSLLWENSSPGAIPAPVKTESATAAQ